MLSTRRCLPLIALTAAAFAAHAADFDPPPAGGSPERIEQVWRHSTWVHSHLVPNVAQHITPQDADGNDTQSFDDLEAQMGADFADWTVEAGDALPGTLSLTAEDDRMVHPTQGTDNHRRAQAGFIVNYRDADPGATYPGNTLRWVQVVHQADCPLPGQGPRVIDLPSNPGGRPFYNNNDMVANDNMRHPITPAVPFVNVDDGDPATPVDDFRFLDFPWRRIWVRPADRWEGHHCNWRADLWLVTWDGETPGKITVHEGIRWGFSAWPLHLENPPAEPRTPRGSGGDRVPMIDWIAPSETLTITTWQVGEVTYADGTSGTGGDPFTGARVTLSPLRSLPPDPVVPPRRQLFPLTGEEEGVQAQEFAGPPEVELFAFGPGEVFIIAQTVAVLTAELDDAILELGSPVPGADSELHARLTNVALDNRIDSRYLDELAAALARDDLELQVVVHSDLLGASSTLTQSAWTRPFEIALQLVSPPPVEEPPGTLPITTAWMSLLGEAAGGRLGLEAGGFLGMCTLQVPTPQGVSASELRDRVAFAVNNDACLALQAVTAAVEGPYVVLRGAGLEVGELILEDPGLLGALATFRPVRLR